MASTIPQEPLLVIIGATGTGKSKVIAHPLVSLPLYLLLQLVGRGASDPLQW